MIAISLPNLAEFKASLDAHADQIGYVMSRTVNELGKLAQIAVRSRTGQIWNVKRQAWVNASVKISRFSNKHDDGGPFLIIGIHALGDDSRSDILTKFEDQTVKLPHLGTHVVIPVGVNANKILREGQRFTDYHFVRDGNTLHDDARRAFIVPIGNGKLLVLQRVDHRVRYKRSGKSTSIAKGDAQPLFLLVPQAHLVPNLEFVQTVQQTVERAFPIVGPAMLDQALASLR